MTIGEQILSLFNIFTLKRIRKYIFFCSKKCLCIMRNTVIPKGKPNNKDECKFQE